jgi:hypothetical protein
MIPADETAMKIGAPESSPAPADFGHKLDEHAVSSDLERASDQRRPVEDLHNLLLRISHHLDYETSERSTIYYRLLAIDAQAKRIESQTKKRALRALARYFVAMCIAVAGTLAWQSYGEANKQTIATRAPELGWSPEATQMIAGWVQQLGWTKTTLAGPEASAVRPVAETLQAIPVAQAAPEAVASKAPATPAVDPEQGQRLMQSLTALQQSVDQLASAQEQLARQIKLLQVSDFEILSRVPAPPPPLPVAAPVRKPMTAPSAPSGPSSRTPTTGH